MACPECGGDVRAGGRCCRECGAAVDRPAEPDAPTLDGLAATVPLLEPGATARNALVAALSVACFPVVVAGALAYGAGTNRYGLGDRLADSPLGRIPTVEDGGWQAAAAVFVAVLLFFALAGAALTGGDGSGEGLSRAAPSDLDPDAAASGRIDAATPTGTPAADGGRRVTGTPGASPETAQAPTKQLYASGNHPSA